MRNHLGIYPLKGKRRLTKTIFPAVCDFQIVPALGRTGQGGRKALVVTRTRAAHPLGHDLNTHATSQRVLAAMGLTSSRLRATKAGETGMAPRFLQRTAWAKMVTFLYNYCAYRAWHTYAVTKVFCNFGLSSVERFSPGEISTLF